MYCYVFRLWSSLTPPYTWYFHTSLLFFNTITLFFFILTLEQDLAQDFPSGFIKFLLYSTTWKMLCIYIFFLRQLMLPLYSVPVVTTICRLCCCCCTQDLDVDYFSCIFIIQCTKCVSATLLQNGSYRYGLDSIVTRREMVSTCKYSSACTLMSADFTRRDWAAAHSLFTVHIDLICVFRSTNQLWINGLTHLKWTTAHESLCLGLASSSGSLWHSCCSCRVRLKSQAA